jgi:hypothetical protein
MRVGIWCASVVFLAGCSTEKKAALQAEAESLKACQEMASTGFRPIANSRDQRFQGKVQEATAVCRGGMRAASFRPVPWVDWSNYWGTADAGSLAPRFAIDAGHLGPDGRGIDGALMDLEYQRVELIHFNLFDNNGTYPQYVQGREGAPGPVLKTWKEMRLPAGHPSFREAGGAAAQQVCRGDLIRGRTLSGICNDIKNPLMGSAGQLFARNVEFDTTFPDEGRNQLTKNRHGDRLGLLKPDPQVISRKLFTRKQNNPDACRDGYGLPNFSKDAECDYQKAPFFNVLAAFWIQFMTHDWFSHLEEGHNQPEWMTVGCDGDAQKLGCRPDDRIDKAYVADGAPGKFTAGGKEYMTRAPKAFRNTNTAWWDASQIYGYDERSRKRVKRDAADRAKLQMAGGFLPVLEASDPMNPEWAGRRRPRSRTTGPSG